MSGQSADIEPRFVPGEVYIRRELHDQYGGQRQGGISTPSKYPFIFIFTSATGKEHGYGYDGWKDSKTFHYTGEGQPDKGDMQFKGGNRAIRDHLENGERIFLFKQVRHKHPPHGRVEFVTELAYRGHHIYQRDSEGIPRKVIVFELERV